MRLRRLATRKFRTVCVSGNSVRRRSAECQALSRAPYHARLRVEPLEDRRMLSVLLVDADAPAGGNGLAWSTAYNDLQPALAQSATLNGDADPANNVDQIWIAEGTYKPSALLESGDVRSASFSLVNGVTLYGGFAGTEATLDQRDRSAHVTTLSGDLGTVGDTTDNAYTVAYCASGVTAGIDGLSITGGNADGSTVSDHRERTDGGAVFNAGALTVANLAISGNSARSYGGAVANSGTLTITNSTLTNNSGAYYGGAVHSSATLIVTSSTLASNSANSGGGIYNSATGTLTVTQSALSDNSTVYGNGGGILSYGVSTITNSTFAGNTAIQGGGIYSSSGMLAVTNCTLSGNSATYLTPSHGGGIYLSGSSSMSTLNNTIVAGNKASSSGPDVYLSSGTLSGTYNLIGDGSGQSALINGVDGNQVGTASSTIDPRLSDWARFDNGLWGHYLLDGSPALNAGNNALALDGQGQPLVGDVRGNVRIQNGTVDIGAVEGATAGSTAQVYTVMSLAETIAVDGVITFLEAFEAAGRNQPVGDAPPGSFTEQDVIGFADDLGGMVFADDGHLAIMGDLSIEGSDAAQSVFQANGRNRVFFVWPGISARIAGITITGGSAKNGGGICSYGTLAVTDCTISGNSVAGNGYNYGGGICSYGTLTVNGSTISGNTASGGDSSYIQGGGIYNYGTLNVADCILSDNSVIGKNYVYGGGVFNTSGTLTLTNCLLSGNSASGNGGGIYNDSSGTLTATNALLWGNSATNGGGICNMGDVTITNSTLSDNTALSVGGGIYVESSPPIVRLSNTIVAENGARYISDIASQFGTLSGSYSLIGDGLGQTQLVNGVNGNQVGTTAAPIDPLLSAAGRPLAGSPAINKGSNVLAVDAQGNPLAVDLDGRPRIIYGTVDVGAYEFCLVADADYSGTVDSADAHVLAAHWGTLPTPWTAGDLNGDGRVNAADAAILAANWGATFTPPAEQSPSAPPARREPVISIGPMPAESTKYEGQRTKNEIGRAKEEPGPTLPPCASASPVVIEKATASPVVIENATDAVLAASSYLDADQSVVQIPRLVSLRRTMARRVPPLCPAPFALVASSR